MLKDLKARTDYIMRVATLSLAGISDYSEEMKFITSTASCSYSISIIFAVILAAINLLKNEKF